jgi:Mrp family chromosome partitioning ATPase
VHDANAQALCTLADAAVLVVTLGQTTRHDIDMAYTEAERAGAVVIGTVVEDGRSRRSATRDRDPRPPTRETDYSPGTAVSKREHDHAASAPSTPGTSGQGPEFRKGRAQTGNNTTLTATSPDWSRFSGDEPPHPKSSDEPDSTTTAVHKAIEA